MRLLIVDDSNIIRSRISRIVQTNKTLNIQIVGSASNGQEALEIAQLTRPDIITMDLTMPKMNGLETIARLMRLYPSTKILVISALDDKSTAILSLRLGACGFLSKPFSAEELLLSLLDAASETK